MPSEIRAMLYRDARQIFDYWQKSPPENEMLAILARTYTTWEPAGTKPKTEQQAQAELRKSQEARWKSGQAMNAKQLFEGMGGGGVSVRADGSLSPGQVITDFPGERVH